MKKNTISDLREIGESIRLSPKIRMYFKEIVEEVSRCPSKVNKYDTLKLLRDGVKTYSKTMTVTDMMLIERYMELVSEVI